MNMGSSATTTVNPSGRLEIISSVFSASNYITNRHMGADLMQTNLNKDNIMWV
jgi:hypothetical protein